MEYVIAMLIVVACWVIGIGITRWLWRDNYGKIVVFILGCIKLVDIMLDLVLCILTKMGGN